MEDGGVQGDEARHALGVLDQGLVRCRRGVPEHLLVRFVGLTLVGEFENLLCQRERARLGVKSDGNPPRTACLAGQ